LRTLAAQVGRARPASMNLFRRRPGAQCEASLSKPLRPADLDVAMRDVVGAVEPWDTSRVVLVRPLQEAARNHGQVQLMEDAAAGNRLMAVKKMPTRWVRSCPKEFDEQYPNATEKPWHDLGFLHHLCVAHFPYACDLYGVFRGEEETFVATSYCAQGDLAWWCDSAEVPAPGPQREEHMMPIVAQIFSAIRWLHDLGIAHRDVSLENILIAGSGPEARVKIIDFGMATLQRVVSGALCVKASYRAPEMHSGEEIDTFLSDIFACGVVVFSMAAQDYPWTCTKPGNCQLFDYVLTTGLRGFFEKRRLRKGSGENLAEVFSPSLVEVLEATMDFQPQQRASLGELAFQEDVQQKRRASVWGLAYLSGADAVLKEVEGPAGSSPAH